jgi:hypothetical protein
MAHRSGFFAGGFSFRQVVKFRCFAWRLRRGTVCLRGIGHPL